MSLIINLLLLTCFCCFVFGAPQGGGISQQCQNKTSTRSEYRQCLLQYQKSQSSQNSPRRDRNGRRNGARNTRPLSLTSELEATGEGNASGKQTEVESETNVETDGRFSSLRSLTKGSALGGGRTELSLGSFGRGRNGQSLLSRLRGGAVGKTSQVTGETLAKEDGKGSLTRTTGAGSASGVGSLNEISLSGNSNIKNRRRGSGGGFEVVGGAQGTGAASVSGSGSSQTTDRGSVSSGVVTGGATGIDGGAEVLTGVKSTAEGRGGTAEGNSACEGGICAAGSVSLTVTGPDGETINQSINTAQAKGKRKSSSSTGARVTMTG